MSGTSFAIILVMKFYIAARVRRKDRVKKIQKMLVREGHEVLSTWVEEGQIIPYNKHSIKAGARSTQCINAIEKCDVFVLISDETGAGMYTELGMAIATNIIKKKPKIFVIGEHINRSMFFFYPAVTRKKDIMEVLKEL